MPRKGSQVTEYTGATFQTITAIEPIAAADKLELASLGNFKTVVKKGEHKVGEKVVFIEADSVLPKDEEWAAPYFNYAPRRVRIIKLRGVFSEGILVPMDVYKTVKGRRRNDIDPSEILKVTHYSPPETFVGNIRTTQLPVGLPKTDETRWESLSRNIFEIEGTKLMTLKIDGQSVTFLPALTEQGDFDYFRVFSRSLEYPRDADTALNRALAEVQPCLIRLMYSISGGLYCAYRGEFHGFGIQANPQNPHAQMPRSWSMYNVFDMITHTYRPWADIKDRAIEADVPCTPTVLTLEGRMTERLVEKIQDGTFLSYGYEGIVVKCDDGSSFKVMNKAYDIEKG